MLAAGARTLNAGLSPPPPPPRRLGAYDECKALPRSTADWCTWTVSLPVPVPGVSALPAIPLIEGLCLPQACAGPAFVPALHYAAAMGLQGAESLLRAVEAAAAAAGQPLPPLPPLPSTLPPAFSALLNTSTITCGGMGKLDGGASLTVAILAMLLVLVVAATVRDLLLREKAEEEEAPPDASIAEGLSVNDLGPAAKTLRPAEADGAAGAPAPGPAVFESSTDGGGSDDDDDDVPLLGGPADMMQVQPPPAKDPAAQRELTAVHVVGAGPGAAAAPRKAAAVPDTWPRPGPPPLAPRGRAESLLVCFSLVRNVPVLLGTARKAGSVAAFDGIRAMSMMWCVPQGRMAARPHVCGWLWAAALSP